MISARIFVMSDLIHSTHLKHLSFRITFHAWISSYLLDNRKWVNENYLILNDMTHLIVNNMIV